MKVNIDIWFDDFYRMLCELPDRTSPDNDPEAIIASREEIYDCLSCAIEEAQDL